MKKTLAVILVAVMLALTLVSCGDGGLNYNKVNLVADGYVTVDESYKTMGNFLSYFVYVPTDDEVRAQIPSHFEHLGVTPDTVDTAAADGNLVNIDYVGTVDGVAFDGGTADAQWLVLGSKTMIDGFEAGIVGMNAGDVKTIDVTFPEDYTEELAGKAAQFEITLNGVYDASILDDPSVFAHVKEELSGQGTDSVWSILSQYVTVNKYPEKQVNELAKTLYKNYEVSIRYQGITDSLESLGVTMESCVEEAKSSVAYELAVYAFVQAEGITYTAEEYNKKASELALANGFVKADGQANVNAFEAQAGKKAIETEVYKDKVIARVIEINETPVATELPTDWEEPADTTAPVDTVEPTGTVEPTETNVPDATEATGETPEEVE